jgi:hypothetical protein
LIGRETLLAWTLLLGDLAHQGREVIACQLATFLRIRRSAGGSFALPGVSRVPWVASPSVLLPGSAGEMFLRDPLSTIRLSSSQIAWSPLTAAMIAVSGCWLISTGHFSSPVDARTVRFAVYSIVYRWAGLTAAGPNYRPCLAAVRTRVLSPHAVATVESTVGSLVERCLVGHWLARFPQVGEILRSPVASCRLILRSH